MNNTTFYKMIALTSVIAIITTTFWTYTEATNHYTRIATAQTSSETTNKTLTVKERIVKAANNEYSELLLNLAQCESLTNEFFHGVNNDRTVDRGVFAINSYQMSHVTDECAFNVECATKYTLKRIKEGDLHLWLCVRTNKV